MITTLLLVDDRCSWRITSRFAFHEKWTRKDQFDHVWDC